jgi:hypothetical protein
MSEYCPQPFLPAKYHCSIFLYYELRKHFMGRNASRSHLIRLALPILLATSAIPASSNNFLRTYKGIPYQDARHQSGPQKILGFPRK